GQRRAELVDGRSEPLGKAGLMALAEAELAAPILGSLQLRGVRLRGHERGSGGWSLLRCWRRRQQLAQPIQLDRRQRLGLEARLAALGRSAGVERLEAREL